MRSAIVAGASGLVGERVLRRLLAGAVHDRVVALVRGPINITHKKLEQRTVDYERLGRMSAFPRADDVFCCLGTTIRKAGSPEAFRRVDVEYVAKLAEVSVRAGSSQFLFVSSVGANPKSGNFYLRCKGEAEQMIRFLPFKGFQIFRPSFLVGHRRERRPGEAFGILAARLVSFAMLGPARRYRPIRADVVAKAMLAVAGDAPPGIHVYEARAMQVLADEAARAI
ncbi:MAG TPA: NAD-dependent epimerase/dehydratase family protein [Thermoanaerobaculia bacterium]|nr:NAD-dependent epimerase/dehydratase family protein [Thermoanaerobaculia bacterium]